MGSGSGLVTEPHVVAEDPPYIIAKPLVQPRDTLTLVLPEVLVHVGWNLAHWLRDRNLVPGASAMS